ncbi:hypothetical protein ACMDCT_09160 [Halomonadaceae bacterium KBTZ08]
MIGTSVSSPAPGHLSDFLAKRSYGASEDLETTLKRYNWLYNHQVPQRA